MKKLVAVTSLVCGLVFSGCQDLPTEAPPHDDGESIAVDALPEAKGRLSARIWEQASLIAGGEAVEVRLEVRCEPGLDVLEAFVYVTQEGNESQFAFIPVTCTGKKSRHTIRAEVYPDGPLFHRGEARASGYVLLEDPGTGDTESVSPTRMIRVR